MNTSEIVFNTNGNDKQKEVCRYWFDSDSTEIVFGGSKSSGKSYLGCSLLTADALVYPETRYFIARKSLNDLRKHTIPSMFEVLTNYGISDKYYKFNGQDNFFKFYNGSEILLLDAKYMPSDPLYTRFGSIQMTRGWIEEGGEFAAEAKSNLSATIGRWKNDEYGIKSKLLITCNPAKNFLYTEFYKPFKDGTIPSWRKFIQAFPEDNKRLPKGYLEHLALTLSANEKERLLFGNWEYDDDPSVLMPYDKIIDIFSNDHVEVGQSYITADIARLGSDNSVIGVWQGWRLVEIVELSKTKITETVAEINKLKSKYRVGTSNIIVDADGVGGGAADMLNCKNFVNNSSPVEIKGIRPNYANLRSQSYFHFSDKVNNSMMFIGAQLSAKQKERIIAELEQIRQKNIDADGKATVISRDELKAKLGYSPDYASMLMMRSYFDFDRGNKVLKYKIT